MPNGYAVVFVRILDSSLAANHEARYVFEDFLLLADEKGIVNLHFQALSKRTGTPTDFLKRAIASLEAPDPDSRDPQNDGRRLIRLYPAREWGWRIVNWAKYWDAFVQLCRQENLVAPYTRTLAPVGPSQRRPSTLDDVLTKAAFIGMAEDDARDWFRDMEICGWAKVDGTPFGNWPREMTIHRDRLREQRTRTPGLALPKRSISRQTNDEALRRLNEIKNRTT